MTLRADHLVVTAGDRRLLDDVSCALRPGCITAIIGPNGAGKSTLLRLLAGLERADSGNVLLDETMLATMPGRDRARRIGYLPQDARAHWAVSVRTLVEIGRIPHRGASLGGPNPQDHEAVDEAMAITDIADFADRTVDTLSGGELARVMLARVLAGRPQWLLADEPFAALDIAHRHALAGPLRAAATAGQGVVVVLHDLSLALRLADEALLLNAGRLVAAGQARQVIAPEPLEAVFGARFALVEAPDGVADLVVAPRFP